VLFLFKGLCPATDKDPDDFIDFKLEISMAKINLNKCDFVLLGDLNANMLPYSRKKEKQELKDKSLEITTILRNSLLRLPL